MADKTEAMHSLAKRRQAEARHEEPFLVSCYAPDEAVGFWDDVPKDLQQLFETADYFLPCEGSGDIDLYCKECIWGEVT